LVKRRVKELGLELKLDLIYFFRSLTMHKL
jgi:hypothetical protein